MKRAIFPIVLALLTAVMSAPARAEEKMVVDMRRLTCRELNKLGFQDFAGVTMWLSGYYNSSIHNTVVDLEEFARAAKAVKDFCNSNRNATVMSAAERALGIQMPK
jgi:acid stress chaperone HdeB